MAFLSIPGINIALPTELTLKAMKISSDIIGQQELISAGERLTKIRSDDWDKIKTELPTFDTALDKLLPKGTDKPDLTTIVVNLENGSGNLRTAELTILKRFVATITSLWGLRDDTGRLLNTLSAYGPEKDNLRMRSTWENLNKVIDPKEKHQASHQQILKMKKKYQCVPTLSIIPIALDYLDDIFKFLKSADKKYVSIQADRARNLSGDGQRSSSVGQPTAQHAQVTQRVTVSGQLIEVNEDSILDDIRKRDADSLNQYRNATNILANQAKGFKTEINRMMKEIETCRNVIEARQNEMKTLVEDNKTLKQSISSKDQALGKQDKTIDDLKKVLASKDIELLKQKEVVHNHTRDLEYKDQVIKDLTGRLDEANARCTSTTATQSSQLAEIIMIMQKLNIYPEESKGTLDDVSIQPLESEEKCESDVATTYSTTQPSDNDITSVQHPPAMAAIVSPNVQNHLKDFEKQVKDMEKGDRLQQIYETTTFAARYFDSMGGYLEIEEADVRLYIPPGALDQQQMIYINLETQNDVIKEKQFRDTLIAPVVQCGPAGATFKQKVTLSYPHCAADESQWEFDTLICQDTDTSDSNWKRDKNADVHVTEDRVVIKVNHFTRFATKARPVNSAALACKNMRVGAFGDVYKQGTPTYQFRVRTWKDTKASTQIVREEEKELNGKHINAHQKLVVRNTKKDVSIEVDRVKPGWKIRHDDRKKQHLSYDEVWKNENPSCTVDLDIKDEANSESQSRHVHCDVKARQLESPDGEQVLLSISPKIVTTIQQDLPDAMPTSIKEDIYGPKPKVKGLSEDLFYDLVGLLNIKTDLGKDWRAIMLEMGRGDMTTLTNVEDDNRQCPANFALRHFLMSSRANGSNDPLKDLDQLFDKLDIQQAAYILAEHRKSRSDIITTHN